ncbi:Hypothetical protein DHA2_150274 [Giardia duodenalis]|uniref:Uncharacterized protein n=1 Tax=Giardia intestinalis TaxID=5741 RepID=V6TGS5_GIAIN|nr:Hypothetical protein DHA2_150274 [Giardia intestinalis]
MCATPASIKFHTWLTKDLGYAPHDERLRPHPKNFDCLSASNESFQEELMRHTVSPGEYTRIRKIFRIMELQKQKIAATNASTQMSVGEQPSKLLELVQSVLVDTDTYAKSEESTRNQLTKIVHLTRVNEALDGIVQSLNAFRGACGSALVDSTNLSETATSERDLLSAQEQAARQFTMSTKHRLATLLRQLKSEIESAIHQLKVFLRDDEEVFEESNETYPDTHPRLGFVYKATLRNIKEGEAILAELDLLRMRENDLLLTYCNESFELAPENITSQVIKHLMTKTPQLGAVLLKAEVFGLQRCSSFLQDHSRELENCGRRTKHLVDELVSAMNKTNTLRQKTENQLQQIEYLTDTIQRTNKKIEATVTSSGREEHRQLLTEKLDGIWKVFSDIHASLDTYSSLSAITSFRDMYAHSLAIRELEQGASSSAVLMRLKEIIRTGATIPLSQNSVSERMVAEEHRHRKVISHVAHSDDILSGLYSHQVRDSVDCIQSVYELFKLLNHSKRHFFTSMFTKTCLLRNWEVQNQVFNALDSFLAHIDGYQESLKSIFSKRIINDHMTDAYLTPSGVTKLGGTANPHLKLDRGTGIVQGIKVAQLDGWVVDTHTLLKQREVMAPNVFSSLISNKLSTLYKSMAPYLLQGESFNSAIDVFVDTLIETNDSQLTMLQTDLALYDSTLRELEHVISVIRNFYSTPI